MRITKELAQPIVNQIMSLLNYNINIMDENGFIVASGDSARLNQRHEGAIEAIRAGKDLIVRENDESGLSGVRPGVNLPIHFLGHTVGVVGITGDPDELRNVTQMIRKFVELLLQQIHMNNQMLYRDKALDGWLHELGNADEFDEAKLESTAKMLGVSHSLERVVMLAEIKQLHELHLEEHDIGSFMFRLNEMREKIVRHLKMIIDPRTAIGFHEGNRLVLLVPVQNKQPDNEMRAANQIEQELVKLGFTVLIGIGERGQSIKGYRDSFIQAKRSLDLLRKLGGQATIAHIEEWGIISIIEQLPENTRMEVVRQYLSNKRLSKELEETLWAFLDNELQIKKTAAALFVHQNTVVYRLERIAEEINLDPRKFNDAILVKILQVCMRLKSNA